MTNLKNILRCYAMGMGIKGISNTFGISRNTVRRYVRKYQESRLSLDKILSMSGERVDEIFTGNVTRERTASPRREALEALLPDYAKRLDRKGTLVKDLFAEYSAGHPDGYKHARFEALLRCSAMAIERLIRGAAFRYKAYLEQIDYTISRGLERNQMERLASLDFVRQGQNLFITGSFLLTRT